MFLSSNTVERACKGVAIALSTCLATLSLIACGGAPGESGGSTTTPVAPTISAAPQRQPSQAQEASNDRTAQIAHIELVAGAAELSTGAKGDTTTLTATALDAFSRPVLKARISFSSEGARVIETDATTDSNGHAYARITSAGDRTNRTVTVRASSTDGGASLGNAAGVSQTLRLEVTGTHLYFPNDAQITPFSDTVVHLQIRDSDGIGIPDLNVSGKSLMGNTLNFGLKRTDGAGDLALTISDVIGGSDTIEIVSGNMVGRFVTTPRFVGPDAFKMTFGSEPKRIVTGVDGNMATLALSVTGADNKPAINAPVVFHTNDGVVISSTPVTDMNGRATLVVSAGADLSNRSIEIEARIGLSTAFTTVGVTGTTLERRIAPLMTVLDSMPWRYELRDGGGKPIKGASIEILARLSADATGNPSTTIDASTFAQTGTPAKRVISTDEFGFAKLEFETPSPSLAGKVVWITGSYGRGELTVKDHQHVYEGRAALETAESMSSSNLLTESSEYRYDAKDRHRLFLTTPEVTIYETANAKGPTSRSAECGNGISKITVQVDGQTITLRGKKISTKTCLMSWAADSFGQYEYIDGGQSFGYYKSSGMETQGIAASDFRIWYDATDNTSLTPGIYIAPVRLKLSQSNPADRKDDFWAYKDIVIFVSKTADSASRK